MRPGNGLLLDQVNVQVVLPANTLKTRVLLQNFMRLLTTAIAAPPGHFPVWALLGALFARLVRTRYTQELQRVLALHVLQAHGQPLAPTAVLFVLLEHICQIQLLHPLFMMIRQNASFAVLVNTHRQHHLHASIAKLDLILRTIMKTLKHILHRLIALHVQLEKLVQQALNPAPTAPQENILKISEATKTPMSPQHAKRATQEHTQLTLAPLHAQTAKQGNTCRTMVWMLLTTMPRATAPYARAGSFQMHGHRHAYIVPKGSTLMTMPQILLNI